MNERPRRELIPDRFTSTIYLDREPYNELQRYIVGKMSFSKWVREAINRYLFVMRSEDRIRKALRADEERVAKLTSSK